MPKTIVIVLPPAPFLLDDRCFLMLGPLQIAAVAREAGWNVKVLDLTGHARRCALPRHDGCTEEVLRYIDREVPAAVEGAALVGVYATGWLMPGVYRILSAIRSLSTPPPVVLGGPNANTMPEARSAEFDYVVVADQGGGGGELGFLEVLRRIESGGPGERGVVRIPSRDGSPFPNDRWPYPARDLVDMPTYSYKIDGRNAGHIVSSTGCPYACNFCAHWEGYRKLVSRSIPHIEGELRILRDRYNITSIMDYSDEVNLYGGGGQPFFDWMDMLERNGIERWRAFFKAGKSERLMSEKMIKRMAETGCHQVCVGAESGSPRVLAKIGKGATIEDNTNFVTWCLKYGIYPKTFIQVGLPCETHETIEETRSWLVSMAGLGLRHIDVAITTPFEGSPIREHPEKFDLTWDEAELTRAAREGWGRGRPGEYVAWSNPSALTRQELVDARYYLDREFAKAASLPLEVRDDG